jgi:hypothetical protein
MRTKSKGGLFQTLQIDFKKAQEKTGLYVNLTGALGRRTKYVTSATPTKPLRIPAPENLISSGWSFAYIGSSSSIPHSWCLRQ